MSVLSGPLQRASKGPGRKERKGKERKGKERKGKERKGKARKGKERKGKERKGSSQKAIFALSGPLRRASKGPGQDLGNFGYSCIKRPFTESLEGPGPRFGEFLLFLYEAVLCKQLRRARAQMGPNLAISVLSGPLTDSLEGLGPRFGQFWLFPY